MHSFAADHDAADHDAAVHDREAAVHDREAAIHDRQAAVHDRERAAQDQERALLDAQRAMEDAAHAAEDAARQAENATFWTERWDLDREQAAPSAPDRPAETDPEREAARLAVLAALERGEIDVDEALRRLEPDGETASTDAASDTR
jgi:hypothetical protein